MRCSPFLAPEAGPATLKPTRWGGTRLATLRGAADMRSAHDPPRSHDPHAEPPTAIGESWEFSTLPGQESRADGRPLGEVLGAPLPFLAKLIDTALPLSVQVHPGDDDAGPGKEEAWIVLAADPGACVWAGLAADREPAEFHRAVAAGTPLLDLLQAIPVVPGSVILVPARTVHAIGGGILLAEIQQPSDTTLRFYDHGSDRPIQPNEALALLDLGARPVVWRPQDPPTTLRGRHVTLEILGPGRHDRDITTPTLLVPARGRVRLDARGDAEEVEPGALRLALAPCRIVVAAGGLCVVGTVQ